MTIKTLKQKIFETIESPDESSAAGRLFDLSLMALIVINLVLVIADTFHIPGALREVFGVIEVISVIIFTVEYALRLWTADLLFPEKSRAKACLEYVFTYMALVDLLAVLPFYIPFIIPLDLRVLKALRIIRLLRLFKVSRYTSIFSAIGEVFKKRIGQLLSSMLIIFLLMVIMSVLMYNAEHAAQPDKFDNAFSSFWWSIVALTTTGYGDIYPVTMAGRVLNGIFAFLGIGFVAIPTGIISAGFVEYFAEGKAEKERDEKHFCPYCGHHLDE